MDVATVPWFVRSSTNWGWILKKIDVPWSHLQREEVFRVSGQYTVPVMVDGDVVIDDEFKIIDYLKSTYPVNSK